MEDKNKYATKQEGGIDMLHLWSRDWEKEWVVDVIWEGPDILTGKLICVWSDANEAELVPAFYNVRQNAPEWVSIC